MVGGIVEEAIFRYGLIRVAMGRRSPKISIPISTAVFLAAHPDYFRSDAPRMLALITLVTAGAGFGYLYVKSATIISPILAHSAYNAAIFGMPGSLQPLESIPAPAIPILAFAIFSTAFLCFMAASKALSAPVHTSA